MSCKKVSPVFSLINVCIVSIFLLLQATPGYAGEWGLLKLQPAPLPALTITTKGVTTTPTNNTNTTTTPTLWPKVPFLWDECIVGNNQGANALCNGSTDATSCYQKVCLAISIINVINEVFEIKPRIGEFWNQRREVDEYFPGSTMLIDVLTLVFGFLLLFYAAVMCEDVENVEDAVPAPIESTCELPVKSALYCR